MRKKLTETKIAAGTYRQPKAKETTFEPLNDFDTVPVEIAGNDKAGQVWNRYKGHFKKVGVSIIDLPLLAAFCVEFATYWQCQEILSKEGNVYKAANNILTPRPEVKIARDAFDRAVRLGAKFGLLLLDRQKLDPAQIEKPKDPKAEKLRKMAEL